MHRARFFLTTLSRHQSGASAVEFALVLPILVALLIGTIDLGRMAWTKMEVQAAARAGAAYALVNATNTFDPAQVSAAVTNATSNLAITVPETPSKYPGCPTSSGVIVAASYSAQCANGTLPGAYVMVKAATTYNPIWSSAVTLNAQAVVRIS